MTVHLYSAKQLLMYKIETNYQYQASHLLGGHIDHVYSNLDQSKFNIDVMMHSPYYTSHDHDAFCITITSKGEDSRKQVVDNTFSLINLNYLFSEHHSVLLDAFINHQEKIYLNDCQFANL